MKGLTLPELLIAMTITVLVGGLIAGMLVNNSGVFYKQASKVGQGLGANDSLAQIRSNIKEARAVAAGYPIGSSTYTSGASQLVLRLATIGSSGNVVLNTYDYVVYHLDNNNLRMRLFPDALSQRNAENRVLANNVNSLNFQYFDNTGSEITPTSAVRVKITLTLSQKAGAGYETSVASSEANLRND